MSSKLRSQEAGEVPRTFEDVIGEKNGGPYAKMLQAIKSAYEDFVYSILGKKSDQTTQVATTKASRNRQAISADKSDAILAYSEKKIIKPTLDLKVSKKHENSQFINLKQQQKLFKKELNSKLD